MLHGFTEDGDFVFLDKTGKPRLRSRIIDLGDGKFQIRADSREEMERLKDRVERRSGKKITDESINEFSSRPQIQNRILVDTLVWQREAAKIGLAVASHVYPPAWRTGADAARLREWLNGKDASTEDGKATGIALGQLSGTPFETLADGPSHLVFFLRIEEVTHLVVVLLGSVLFSVPVDSSGSRTPRVAWKLDPNRPQINGKTTWDALLGDAAQRFIAEQPMEIP
jgi:hypothetical protein